MMGHLDIRQALIATAAICVAVPAHAASLFRSLPDLTVAPVVRGYCSSCNSFLQFRIYDRFDLANASTINAVTFAVDRQTIPGTTVNIGFFNTDGARPGGSIAGFDVSLADLAATEQATALDNIFLYTAQIGSLALDAGTYDISFFNPNGLSIPAYAKPGNTLYQSGNFFQGESFYADRAAAFALDGVAVAAIPEPASWGLMIVGFGAVGGSLRYRRRRAAVSYA